MKQPVGTEEEYFLSHVEDALEQARFGKVKYIGFLDEHQQLLAENLIRSRRQDEQNTRFFGGFEEAERKVLGVFPDYLSPEEEPFPIQTVTFLYRKEDKLSHRDFLGAMMGLQIKRECIGDILVGEGMTAVFVLDHISQLLADELSKVGRVGVRGRIMVPDELPQAHRFSDISGTVSSLRLDCMIALLLNISREKAHNLILSGSVFLNACEINSVSHLVSPGDKIAVRGTGKFLVEQVGAVTKKGRTHVECKKYV